MVKFFDLNLYSYGLVGAGLDEEGYRNTALTFLSGICASYLCGTECDPTCGREPARGEGESCGSQLLLSLLFS